MTRSELRQELAGTWLLSLEPAANALRLFCKYLTAAGMAIFMVLVIITFFDVFMRYFFSRPFSGTVELTELLMSIVVFSSIAYVQWSKNHVVMDIFTGSLSKINQDTLNCVTLFWSLLVCALSIYATARFALTTKTITVQLGITIKPFIWFVTFGFLTIFLTVLWDWLLAVTQLWKISRVRVLAGFVVAVLVALAAFWLSTHRLHGVSSIVLGCLGIIFMFVLFLTGMPVAFALMAVGFVFAGPIRGVIPAVNFYGKAMYTTSASYAWSPLMFFMLMGYFCFYGNLGRDLYDCARRWLGHFRGGLAQGSVCACTAFGAVVGDNLSGSIAMSAIALPEMRAAGYDDKLAVGTLACSGTIGTLIPPSTSFILYGVLSEQSIADLFMAGAIPGIICTVIYCATVWFMVWRNPSLARPCPREPMASRLKSLSSALPILLLFILVIGGIYGGMFTPTEGGAIGAVGALILGICMKRFTVKNFIASLNDSAKYITMSFSVLTGATVLGYFMTLSRIPQALAGSIASIGMSAGVTMLAIIVVLFFLGCFVPALPLILICVPIFLPIAQMFHWDLIWFGVLMVIMLNMGTITPPFGINLFVIKEVAHVSLRTMFAASVPFVLGMTLLIVIVYFVPGVATWLPAVMR
ncbi:TRAP transporter large permease subunit [Mailhella sp.]|uniref:TRAP transporter large permease n=1 Tax=Mailhella sp. TaxID=1981029 RepID=UPI003AB56563